MTGDSLSVTGPMNTGNGQVPRADTGPEGSLRPCESRGVQGKQDLEFAAHSHT